MQHIAPPWWQRISLNFFLGDYTAMGPLKMMSDRYIRKVSRLSLVAPRGDELSFSSLFSVESKRKLINKNERELGMKQIGWLTGEIQAKRFSGINQKTCNFQMK